MLEFQFKSLCRLNRVLVLTMAVLTWNAVWAEPGWQGHVLRFGLPLLHFVFLMGNEFLLKMLKRLRDADIRTISHISVLLPVALWSYITLGYAASGSLFVYTFSLFAILEGQFLGQSKLAGYLAIASITVFLGGMLWGLPHPATYTLSTMALPLVGWGICLYYLGVQIARLVRSYFSQVDKLQSMAATDVLTGLTNRRQFNSRMLEEVARARRHATPLSLALFDLDDFKRLNDFYGHPVGDRILRELGKLVRQNIRESDLPARYGGEEFALILPETREAEAYELLERIRLLISQNVFCLPENPLTLTVSIGVAQLDPRQHTAFELVELADQALYEAKKQGKNQVVAGSTLMPKVLLSKKSGKF